MISVLLALATLPTVELIGGDKLAPVIRSLAGRGIIRAGADRMFVFDSRKETGRVRLVDVEVAWQLREALNSRLQKERPDIIVVDPGHDGASDPATADWALQSFEPHLRDVLTLLVNQSWHPRVFVAKPNASGSLTQTYLLPLEGQAIHESRAMWLDIEPAERESVQADDLADLIAPHAAKAGWHIVRASSQQADEGPATNAIDGDPNTYWHTQYDPVMAKPPHELVIDLGQTIWLAGFRYTPRQDGGDNGIARDYELYVGDSADKQTALAAKGTFKRGPDRKSIRFTQPVHGRYLRLVILSAQNRQPYGSAAEIDIIRDHTHE